MISKSPIVATAFVLCFGSALLIWNGEGKRISDEPPVFTDFLANIEKAQARDYVGRGSNSVSDPKSFEEMRSYLLAQYRGEHVTRSYYDKGEIFDCVPYWEQPGTRAQVHGANTDLPPPEGSTSSIKGATLVWDTSHCPEDTISWQRLTLQELARYPSLAAYFDSVIPSFSGSSIYP